MPDRHEPRHDFVEALAARVRRELAGRQIAAAAPWWLPRSRASLVAALAVIVIVSMALGGGMVAAAYQAQSAGEKGALVDLYAQRVKLAERQAELAQQRLSTTEQRVAVGGETQTALEDVRAQAQAAAGELRTVTLQLEEVRASGREPQDSLSAPRVGSRDFVTERLRVQLDTSAAAARAGELGLKFARVRMNNGLANNVEVQTAGARFFGVQAALTALQKKMQIRETFLAGRASAALTDLRGLEVDAEQRRTTLTREIELATDVIRDLKARVEIGTMAPIDVAQAEVRLRELELAATKADYDLVLIRQQIGRAK